MIDKNAVKHIEEAVAVEMNAAVENYGCFNSNHEAWAVLKEEIQEVTEISTLFVARKNFKMDKLWNAVRGDKFGRSETDTIENIREGALEIAKECIQVAAVCDKWKQSNKHQDDVLDAQLAGYFMQQFTEIDTEVK